LVALVPALRSCWIPNTECGVVVVCHRAVTIITIYRRHAGNTLLLRVLLFAFKQLAMYVAWVGSAAMRSCCVMVRLRHFNPLFRCCWRFLEFFIYGVAGVFITAVPATQSLRSPRR